MPPPTAPWPRRRGRAYGNPSRDTARLQLHNALRAPFKINVQPGQTVHRGDPLQAPWATPANRHISHLHYEVRFKGIPQNPVHYYFFDLSPEAVRRDNTSGGKCRPRYGLKSMADSLDKRYYKISDVSEILGLPIPTIRFWEGQFSELRPKRSDGGTRRHTPADIERLRVIRFLVGKKD